jgi:hypothetical protein
VEADIRVTTITIVMVEGDINPKARIMVNNLDINKVVMRVAMTILNNNNNNNNNTVSIMHNMAMIKVNLVNLDKMHLMVRVSFSFII